MVRYARITGWGKHVPEKVLTNHDLEKMVDTSDEWIMTRTGIRERRVAAPKETTSTMAVKAGRRALEVAGLDARELDLIIVATYSPDHLLAPVASMVQDKLGASRASAFDLGAGCTGFIYALATGHQFIACGTYDNVLIIGAEVNTRFLDWQDRNTCVLFGDGAGAVVLQASQVPSGITSMVMGSDGSGTEHIFIPGGGSRHPFDEAVLARREHFIKMDGSKVFKFASRILSQATLAAVENCGLSLDDIALVIPHQANARILEAACKKMELPPEKMYTNLERYGNTSAASVPIALCEAVEEGRIHDGDNIVLVGFGAGLTWGAMLVHWGVPEVLPIPWKFLLGFEVPSVVRDAALTVSSLAGLLLLPFLSRSKD